MAEFSALKMAWLRVDLWVNANLRKYKFYFTTSVTRLGYFLKDLWQILFQK